MNSAQVRAKARVAIKRREDRIEEEETEGGEINLIPYLDIVTNLMLFLLAISSAGFVLGQIDTTLPDHSSAKTKPPAAAIDKEPALLLVASITTTRIELWSISKLEGTLQAPRATIERVQANSAAPTYDYQKLNDALYEIAARRWSGKARPKESYEIILMADDVIPYETVIDVMDAMRRRLYPTGALAPVSDANRNADGTPRDPPAPYDPNKHYLFPDVLFSAGFE